MSRYPDGTGASDPHAPWNAKEAEKCAECGGRWEQDGHKPVSDTIYTCCNCEAEWDHTKNTPPDHCPDCQSEDIQLLPCPNEGLTMEDFEEIQRSENAEQLMDQQRVEQRAEHSP